MTEELSRLIVRLDPDNPIEIPEGYRVGRIQINGKWRERTNHLLYSRDDDNRMIKKLCSLIQIRKWIKWMK